MLNNKNMWYNLVKINKTWVREFEGFYHAGIFIQQDVWVDYETIELLVYEHENGVKEM